MSRTAIIFEEVTGWHVSDEKNDCLDARGKGYRTKTAAIRAASASGYTHYKNGAIKKKISKNLHLTNWATG